MLRKQITSERAGQAFAVGREIDVAEVATVQFSSEQNDHPIDHVCDQGPVDPPIDLHESVDGYEKKHVVRSTRPTPYDAREPGNRTAERNFPLAVACEGDDALLFVGRPGADANERALQGKLLAFATTGDAG